MKREASEVARVLREVSQRGGLDVRQVAERTTDVLRTWLSRASAGTWTEPPPAASVSLDEHGLELDGLAEVYWPVACTFALAALDERDPAHQVLTALGPPSAEHAPGTVGAWLSAGGADALEITRGALSLRLDLVRPAPSRPSRGDEAVVLGAWRVDDRTTHFLWPLRSSAQVLPCPASEDAARRWLTALEELLDRVAAEPSTPAVQVLEDLGLVFAAAVRAPLPARSWADVVERELLAPLLVDRPRWSLPEDARPFVELLRLRDGDLDVALYVDDFALDRRREVGAIKPWFRLAQRDADGELTNLVEQQTYLAVLPLVDFHRPAGAIDPAWLGQITARWRELLTDELRRSLEQHRSLPMPNELVFGEPVRACRICLEEGGPPQLERPAARFDPQGRAALESAARLRRCTERELADLPLDGVELAVFVDGWTIALVPRGEGAIYLARGETIEAIARNWGPDGASCDGDEATFRGFVEWLVAALDAQQIHATWRDDWGHTTSATPWLRFDEQRQVIDWRGADGLVSSEPFRPESEALRARALYHAFIRAQLAPDWVPSSVP